jgi:transaldolase/transaldolase/glucose-6-phosphate isomerase
MNQLTALFDTFGQSIWLDFIRRDLLTGGNLQTMIRADGIRGVTSNPSIFHKAIAGSDAYDAAIAGRLAHTPGIETEALYEALAIEDIQRAADILRSVYDASGGADGFVSLEVSPHLANRTDATVAEARRLWGLVGRPNVMIKVPATEAGIPAIETLIAGGINVNATLMFSMSDYEAVANAYVKGVAACGDPARVASVASFFVSRVDTAVDRALEEIGTNEALELRGRAAVANAKLVYRRFTEIFHGEAFAPLAARGAHVQRPLWASTSTKNPNYSPVKYVEELIGPETVNTVPLVTLEAFRDVGKPRRAVDRDLGAAEEALAGLAALGIDLDDVTAALQADGVEAFCRAYDALLETLEGRRREMGGDR